MSHQLYFLKQSFIYSIVVAKSINVVCTCVTDLLKHLMVRYNQYVAYNDNIGGVRKDLCSIFFWGGWGVFNSVVEKHSQGSWLVTSG